MKTYTEKEIRAALLPAFGGSTELIKGEVKVPQVIIKEGK